MTAPKPTKAELIKHVRMEQERVWNQLSDDLRTAFNGQWSIGVANTIDNLLDILKLVPPTPWDHIQYELVRGGIYEAVLLAAGIEPKLPSAKEIAETDLAMKRHFDRPLDSVFNGFDSMPKHYAYTVEQIKEEFGPF